MNENITKNIYEYVSKAFTGTKPFWGAIFGFAGYILFPVPFYRASFLAVMAASFCDILTKIYMLCKKYDGFKNAVKLKMIFSKTLWKGTEVKIVSYLFVSVLTGLSNRVVYLEGLGILIASFVYSVMFMREFQSNVENLMDAGADLGWLLLFSKKKNKELMKPYEEETPKSEVNEDYEQRI